MVISYAMKLDIHLSLTAFEFDGTSMKTETTTRSVFSNGGKTTLKQILTSEKRRKSKVAKLQESQLGIQVGKLTI